MKPISIVTTSSGYEVDYEAAVIMMDDDLREELHQELAPCTDQAFFDAYCERHRQKFGEEFDIR